jgi:predicted metal-dependent hydrolase
VALVRAYANISDELEDAGYSNSDIARIKQQQNHYLKVREIVRLASGESLDMKAYEADMRHLIDTYVGVQVARFYVQRMRTRWGSCNPITASIRLNTDLAKKPQECLEYIVVHEMVHLLEPTHNDRFVALMDRYLPNWQHQRQMLNRLPVRHEDWEY